MILSNHNCHPPFYESRKQASILVFKGNLCYFNSTHSIRNIADSNWSTGCWSPDKPDTFLKNLMCYSATDALKGEGLQEGVDWLQGMIKVRVWAGQWVFNSSINLYRFSPSVYKQFTQWDVSDSLILFSFYHLHCFHSNSSIDQIIQWVHGGRPVLRYGGTQVYSVSVTGFT